MLRHVQLGMHQSRSVVNRLRVVRSYLRSIHAACLHSSTPLPGHVLLVDENSWNVAGIPAGGYTLIAEVGESVLLSPIRLSHCGELEYSERLVTARRSALSAEMIVGRESMIIPD